MKVKATPGVKVPYEDRPYAHIEQTVVDVPDTTYYRRRIADGDLIKVIETRSKKEDK
ncbi:DUF2635 domain-containing protein [Actinobacillus sp. GY-402]|nr:DUF2635 domain-containing protein [Actinobacillus sp. GY-402]